MNYNKLIFWVIAVFFLVLPVIAQEQSLGIFKQNSCIELRQNCNCTYVNFTSVHYPNSTQLMGNVEATRTGTIFTYTICNASVIGEYIVNGIGDVEGDTVFVYNFKVTKHGDDSDTKVNNVSFIIIAGAFLFFIVLVVVGFVKADAMWLKSGMAVVIAILVMSLTRFMAWFVEIITPNQTPLIDTLHRFYAFGVWGVRITITFMMFVVLITILNSIRMNNKRKKDNWDSWGS